MRHVVVNGTPVQIDGDRVAGDAAARPGGPFHAPGALTVRAAVLEAAGKPLVVDESIDDRRPAARPGAGAGARTAACATPTSPCVQSAYQTPIVVGHEAAGTVDAVGEGVTSLRPGDRVVLTPDPAVRAVLLLRARRARRVREQPRHHVGHVPRRQHRAVARR